MNKLIMITAVALGISGFGSVATLAASSSAMDSSMMDSSMGASSMAPMAFDDADKDKDGFVDLDEAQAAYPGLGGQQFTEADLNKDGKLDATEFGRLGAPMTTVDNGNGNNNTTTNQPSSSAQ